MDDKNKKKEKLKVISPDDEEPTVDDIRLFAPPVDIKKITVKNLHVKECSRLWWKKMNPKYEKVKIKKIEESIFDDAMKLILVDEKGFKKAVYIPSKKFLKVVNKSITEILALIK